MIFFFPILKFMTNIKLEFKKAWELINSSQRIFLTTHEGTDGDDLGSLLAMFLVLGNLGKKTSAAVKGGVPESLKFLPNSQTVADRFEKDAYDLILTFGCNTLARTGWGEELGALNCPIVNFDHHPDNKMFGTVNVVDSQTAAVAELIFYFLDYCDVELDKDMATCLLTGIFTDTGGFKHANTSPTSLEAAAKMLQKGVRIDKIAYQTMGKKTEGALRAWARALENARFVKDKQMVFSVLTEEDIKETGASDDDLDGVAEFLNNLPQARLALFLRQAGDEIKGSLRSEPEKRVDVSEIARSFGGGGHKLAAGFKLKGKLVKDKDAWKIV